jgi:uncharacterized damage-inducible protein DinB
MPARHRRFAIPATYARELGGDDPVEAMAEAPDRLRRAIRGLTEKQLATRPAPGKWTIKEILAHLADGEVILGSRYRFIAAHDRPRIQSYEQDLFAARLGALNARAADLVDDFAMVRAANIGLLERLPDEAWDRVGLHAERGEESIRKLVHLYAGHDRHHLAQVETIRTGLFPKDRRRKARKARGGRRRPAGRGR